MKELEEMVFKEKNRILQEKLENSDPYEQYLELVKKRRQGKKKPRTRKSVLGFNNLIGSSKSINFFNNSKSFPRAKIKKYPILCRQKKKSVLYLNCFREKTKSAFLKNTIDKF